MARLLGFGYSREWSQDEIKILTQQYHKLGAEETAQPLAIAGQRL